MVLMESTGWVVRALRGCRQPRSHFSKPRLFGRPPPRFWWLQPPAEADLAGWWRSAQTCFRGVRGERGETSHVHMFLNIFSPTELPHAMTCLGVACAAGVHCVAFSSPRGVFRHTHPSLDQGPVFGTQLVLGQCPETPELRPSYSWTKSPGFWRGST